MACTPIRTPHGLTAIVCGLRPRRHRCSAPGCEAWATHQCDCPTDSGRSCDRWICAHHAAPRGPGIDYCPKYHRLGPAPLVDERPRQGGLFDGGFLPGQLGEMG